MNAERIRTFLLALPHVVETAQWGGIVFWVGDKAIGGKMFAMMNPEGGDPLVSYATHPERYPELLEIDGIRPAPYLARMSWVAIGSWNIFRMSEWEEQMRSAQAVTFMKLPAKTKALLELPKVELRRAVAEARTVAEGKLAAARSKKATKK